jgi:hypothetical protein
MRKALVLCFFLAGCASAADIAAYDDAKCRSYGAKPGDPAYVTCRSQLDAARTQAAATIAAAPLDTPPIQATRTPNLDPRQPGF